MSTKVAVVTGANKGIGFGIVKRLCKEFDGVVCLTARNEERGKKAVEEIKKLGLKSPIYYQLDISDDSSIKNFASKIKNEYGGIDVLVNNAAIAFKHDAKESFGVQAEETIRINYLSLLKICKILFPLLRPHARVVVLSSSCGHLPLIPSEKIRKILSDPELTEETVTKLMNDFVASAKDGTYKEKGWPKNTYVVSKVGASALTRVFHKEFLNDTREDIIINHVHPGYVDTDMTSHKGPLTIDQGADAPSYLALLPKYTISPKGDYVWYNKEIMDWVNVPTPNIV